MRQMRGTKTEVLHYRPSPNGFFSGRGGYQILAETRRTLFLKRIKVVRELDREEVPHWHYVQRATLGFSEWRSKFAELINKQTEEANDVKD